MQGSQNLDVKVKKSEDEDDLDQPQTGCYPKIQPVLAKIFSLDVSLLPQVGVLKLALIYIMLFEVLHITLLFSVLQKTNSSSYLISSAVFSGIQIVTYLSVRLSTKFVLLKAIGIITIMTILGQFGVSILFIQNLTRLQYFCDMLSDYYFSHPNYAQKTNQMCTTIKGYFYGGETLSLLLIASRVVAVSFILKAHRVTKHQYDQNQMKKRRKDKYNELLLKKHKYNKDRQL